MKLITVWIWFLKPSPCRSFFFSLRALVASPFFQLVVDRCSNVLTIFKWMSFASGRYAILYNTQGGAGKSQISDLRPRISDLGLPASASGTPPHRDLFGVWKAKKRENRSKSRRSVAGYDIADLHGEGNSIASQWSCGVLRYRQLIFNGLWALSLF